MGQGRATKSAYELMTRVISHLSQHDWSRNMSREHYQLFLPKLANFAPGPGIAHRSTVTAHGWLTGATATTELYDPSKWTAWRPRDKPCFSNRSGLFPITPR